VASRPGAGRTEYLQVVRRVLGAAAGGDTRRPDAPAPVAHTGLILPPD
jgi:hypothetical protein